jgi:hypothetical protein
MYTYRHWTLYQIRTPSENRTYGTDVESRAESEYQVLDWLYTALAGAFGGLAIGVHWPWPASVGTHYGSHIFVETAGSASAGGRDAPRIGAACGPIPVRR